MDIKRLRRSEFMRHGVAQNYCSMQRRSFTAVHRRTSPPLAISDTRVIHLFESGIALYS